MAGDSMTEQNGMQFTTFDRDNDNHGNINCASSSYRQGGWWYRSCGYVNFNGLYCDDQINSGGVIWYHFNATAGRWRTLRFSDMKLRRSD